MGAKLAFYFGAWSPSHLGHHLHKQNGYKIYWPTDIAGFPWTGGLLDGGLLENAKVSEPPDGRVFWTCGGKPNLWFAFYWWDRSADSRGKSNSGFYVTGFTMCQEEQALAYAKDMFPGVVARQRYPLVLQPHLRVVPT